MPEAVRHFPLSIDALPGTEGVVPVMPTQTKTLGAAAYLQIRNTLFACTKEACVDGRVYWERDKVVDRDVDIEGLAGKVRYVPTFAYRLKIYNQMAETLCRLCDAIEDPLRAIPLIDDEAATIETRQFNQSFACCLNNFPYIDKQVLLSSRQHRTLFADSQYGQLFDFMAHATVAGASMQLKESGATIADHAHISVFDETLPIFSNNYRPLQEIDGTMVAVSVEHPSICYKVEGGSLAAKQKRTLDLISRLELWGFSFNLYLDGQANSYIVPRTRLQPLTEDIKVGASLPAGVHNAYPEKSPSRDIDRLKQELWEEAQTITGKRLATALRETTVQGEDPAAIL